MASGRHSAPGYQHLVQERPSISWIPRSQVMSKRSAQFTTMGLCLTGFFMLFVALIAFSPQGSQIRVTATVLSESCHPKFYLATGPD